MKKQQTFFALFLTAAMILSLLLPVSAEGFKAESANTAASALSYIPEADAALIAENIMQNRIGRDDCPWTEETRIDETVRLFDFDGAVSGYLFRLTTAGKSAGYVQVDAYAEAPQAVAFGYDCEAALDSMRKAQGKPEAASEDGIIALGVYDFIETDETGYQDMATGRKIDAPAAELSAAYKAHKAEQKDETQKARLITLKAQNSLYATKTTVQPQAQIVYEHVNVPNLWAPYEFLPFKHGNLGNKSNDCGVVAGMNLLKYWYERRGVRNLYSTPTDLSATYRQLAAKMKHDRGGTYPTNQHWGMLAYLDDYGLTQEAGSDYTDRSQANHTINWNWFSAQIRNGNAVIVSTEGYIPAKEKPHALLGLGFQNCNDGKWIRVADAYDNSISHFLKYQGPEKEYALSYLRW